MKLKVTEKLIFLLTVFLSFNILAALSQGLVVKGIVTDNANVPLIGVNVSVTGSTIGTITDIEGAYTITVPSRQSTLRFSYIGFMSTDIPVEGRALINVVLEENVHDLEELVVIGYGVQKKSHLTGSISQFSDEHLGDLPVSRLDQALQGKIAGLEIRNTTSEAGFAPEIRVRGLGSISASNAPLIVVDGYPMLDGLSSVDMNDVQSIEVLKDAASTAIYGSRGANGVIIVTTKAGSITKPKYSVKAYSGVKTSYKLHDLLDANEYVDRLMDEKTKGGVGPTISELSWKSIDNYTDWQKEGLRENAYINNVQFSLSGGSKSARYYISGNYLSDQGVMINSDYTKLNMRVKLDADLSEKVKVGVNLSPTYSKRESPSANFTDFYRTYSWLPVRHTAATSAITGEPIGSYAHGRHFNNKEYIDADGNVFVASPWGTGNNNPRSIIDNESRNRYDYRLNGSMYLDYNILDNLIFRTSNGFYVRYEDEDIYHNKNTRREGDPNYARYTNTLFIDLLSENTLNYSQSIDGHNFDILAGYTANKVRVSNAGIQGTNFPTDYIKTINAASEIAIEDDGRRTYTDKEEEMLLSGLSRLTYNYQDKYLFSGSIRTDGSSKFGPENQWGWFPSVSAGWRASEEPFLKKIDKLNQLRLRASWGVTGNNSIPNYAAYDKLQSANYILGAESVLYPGLANTDIVLANRAISWEQTSETNLGFDLNAFNTRLNLSVDYYYSVTKSLLFRQPTLAITGYQQFWNNIGKVRNRGIEVELTSYNIRKKNFEWSTSFNFATNNNRLLQLGDGEERLLSYGERSEIYLAKVGAPSIQYFGYKTDGIWISQSEIDESNLQVLVGKTVRPGTLKVVDQDANNIIDANDRVALGDPFPMFTWGMTNNINYKNFDLTFSFHGVHDVTVLNGDAYYQETKKINRAFTENRYISEEYPGDGKTPHLSGGDGMQWELTDYVLEDASYIALGNLMLGYQFPRKSLKMLGLNNLRVYLTAQNLLYYWYGNYRGINPEARYTSGNYSSPLVDGYQRGSFPIQRTFSAGLEISF